MTIKERAHMLIDSLPDDQVFHITQILTSMTYLNIEEVEPDEIDKQMLKEIDENNDVEFVTFEEALKELGLNSDDF